MGRRTMYDHEEWKEVDDSAHGVKSWVLRTWGGAPVASVVVDQGKEKVRCFAPGEVRPKLRIPDDITSFLRQNELPDLPSGTIEEIRYFCRMEVMKTTGSENRLVDLSRE